MYIFHDQHSVDQFNKGQEKSLREMRTRSTFFIRIKKKKLEQVLNLKEFNSSLHKKNRTLSQAYYNNLHFLKTANHNQVQNTIIQENDTC